MKLRKLSKPQTLKFWHDFVKDHYAFERSLILDKKMSALILNNKVFGPVMYKKKLDRHYRTYATTTVSGLTLTFKRYYSRPSTRPYRAKWVTYTYEYCYGENQEGYLAYEVKKMKYLSQFLMTYSAWLAKKNSVTF